MLKIGRVVLFDVEAGLGVVEDPTGEAWQFHCTTIAGGSRHIEPGTAAAFTVGPGGPGRWEAFEVSAIT